MNVIAVLDDLACIAREAEERRVMGIERGGQAITLRAEEFDAVVAELRRYMIPIVPGGDPFDCPGGKLTYMGLRVARGGE